MKRAFSAQKTALGCPVGFLIALNFWLFFRLFFGFSGNFITSSLVLPVQKSSSDEVLEPAMIDVLFWKTECLI
jgi:hypothetical protein